MDSDDATPDRLSCHDCGAAVGEPHENGCDIARCMWTGGQRLQCDLGLYAEVCRVLRGLGETDLADEVAYHQSIDDEAHDCGCEVWTGEWPGMAECREFGWFSWFGPDLGVPGWQRIEAEHVDLFKVLHPGVDVSGDLNRLVCDARWDRSQARWVRRDG